MNWTYRIFGIVFFMLLTGSVMGQNREGEDTIKVKKPAPQQQGEAAKEPEIFVVVEEMPRFPGGDQAMMRFIHTNLNYPDSAIKYGIQGKVMVEFIIDETGRVTNARIVRGIGWGCDEEVLRIVNMMPKWTPGKQKGKPVKVRFVLPIRFQLQ